VQGDKQYSFAKYQMPDDELSESFERQMLLEMKRDAAMCTDDADDVDSGNPNSRLLSSQLKFGEDPTTDSSDEDTSTVKSPVCVCLYSNSQKMNFHLSSTKPV